MTEVLNETYTVEVFSSGDKHPISSTDGSPTEIDLRQYHEQSGNPKPEYCTETGVPEIGVSGSGETIHITNVASDSIDLHVYGVDLDIHVECLVKATVRVHYHPTHKNVTYEEETEDGKETIQRVVKNKAPMAVKNIDELEDLYNAVDNADSMGDLRDIVSQAEEIAMSSPIRDRFGPRGALDKPLHPSHPSISREEKDLRRAKRDLKSEIGDLISELKRKTEKKKREVERNREEYDVETKQWTEEKPVSIETNRVVVNCPGQANPMDGRAGKITQQQ